MKKLFRSINKCSPGGGAFYFKINKLKVKYKKDPKKFITLIIAILGLFSCLIGSSYAYLTYVSKTNNSTVISAGTLTMNFKNESNAITLSSALPQEDSDALSNNSEYEFTIENTGSISASYKVTLDNTCVQNKEYTISGDVVKADLCIPNEYIKVAIKEGTGDYKVIDYKNSNDNSSYVIEAGSLSASQTKTYKMKIWLDYDTPNTYNGEGIKNVLYIGKLGLSYEQGASSKVTCSNNGGANAPVLSSNMIPVYYDETDEVWKKADSTNENSTYKWYDYCQKMWANSVTVSSSNRSTYLKAKPGTEISMDDILTMQVWIPRYKYKIFNYNASGTTYVDPQKIEITFESGTATTGEVTCTDSISGTDGAISETCKLKSTSATCTDSTCNGKTYTHPAFTFGDEELTGMWVGKFEISAPETSDCYTGAGSANCNVTGITPLVKPNVRSYRYAQVGTFETNIMAMNDSGNIYGFSTSDDTHMLKNMEWGAVAYLSHSKYGTCTGGICEELSINNSSSYYTGRSGGSTSVYETTNGTYKYNETKQTTKTLTGGTTITLAVTNNTTYPWTETDGVYKSLNQGVDSSTTSLTFSFTAPSDNTYLSFDWSVSSERYDYIYYTITKDGTALSDTGECTLIGGTSFGKTEDALIYKNVVRQLEAGSYKVTFTYIKDNAESAGTDTGYVKNIKVLDSPTVNTKVTEIGKGIDGPSASTTHNIYGIYDMSGGAYDSVMGNVVSPDGSTMMSGEITSYNSGYTGIIYDSGNYTNYTGTYSYPENKYLDKYSFGTNYKQRIITKLGDAIKEVGSSSYSNWYSVYGYEASAENPWFYRGGLYGHRVPAIAGLFDSVDDRGSSGSGTSTRIVIAP